MPTPRTLAPVWAAHEGHDGRAWGVAWSPDGSTLASCGADRTIRLWTRNTDRASSPAFTAAAVLEESATRTVRALAWSPCGGRLAAACFDATAAVWERAGGRGGGDPDTWRQAAVLQGHESEVKGVAWAPGGSHLASCSRDKSVWVWEVVPCGDDGGDGGGDGAPPPVEYECADVKQGHTADVKAVAWHPAPEAVAGCASPGGGFLVSASYDETIRVWADAGDEWVCAQVMGVGDGGHAGTVWCVDFEKVGVGGGGGSGSGGKPPPPPRLASGGGDSSIRVWACPPRPPGSSPDDDTAWSVGCALDGAHSGRPVYSVAWAPPGPAPGAPARLASAGGDDVVRVWEEGEAGTAGGGAAPFSFVEVASAKAEPACEMNAVAWCPTDRDLVAAAGDDGVVRVWRVQ